MHLGCRIGWHKAASTEVWNNGLYFARCSRCDCELIRPAVGRWKPVPRGFRIVWKPRTVLDIDWQAWTSPQQEERAQRESPDATHSLSGHPSISRLYRSRGKATAMPTAPNPFPVKNAVHLNA